jgi:hypothetical protein
MSLSHTVLSRWMGVQLDKRGVQHLCGDHIWHLSIIWGQASYDRRRSPAGQKDVLRRIHPVWFGHCNDAVQGEWCPVVCDGPRLWRVCDDIGTQSRPGSVSPNSYTMRTAVGLVLNLTLSNSLIMWVGCVVGLITVCHSHPYSLRIFRRTSKSQTLAVRSTPSTRATRNSGTSQQK